MPPETALAGTGAEGIFQVSHGRVTAPQVVVALHGPGLEVLSGLGPSH